MKRKAGLRERVGARARAEEQPPEATASSSTDPPLRGGIRQRAARNAVPEPSPDHDGPFTNSLKRQWAGGRLTSPQVQELAITAGQQGAHSVGKLGAVGNSGQSPQHLQRALKQIFGQPLGSPDFTWVPLDMKIDNTVKQVAQPVLLPHLYFQAMHRHRHDLWDSSVIGPEEMVVSTSGGACRTLIS